jgi:hypothetical protein
MPLLMIVLVFVVLGLLSLLTAGAVPQMYTGAYVLVLPYALFRWGSGREAVIGSVIVFVKAGLSDLPDVTPRPNVGLGFAVLFSVMALGAVFRFRAAARMRELDRAKLLERERLARDLHDTVAHHVSAIAIRAQAGLATAASRPDAAVEALRVIEAEASSTLTQMRSMVRVLRRNEPAELAPSPCIADLERLAGRDGADPPVDVEVRGDFAEHSAVGGGSDLPPRPGVGNQRPAACSSRHPHRGSRRRRRFRSAPARKRRRRYRPHAPGRATGVRPHRHDRTRPPARRHLRSWPGSRPGLDRDRRAAPGGMTS